MGRRQPEYVESWLNNAGFKRGWSGSQVRLTRLELTDLPHWSLPPPRSQPIHPAPGRAARSRAISRYLGRSRGRAALSRAISRYLGRSRGRAALSRAISERRSRGVTPAQKGRRLEAGGHAPSRAPSSPGFWPPGRRPTVAARGSRPSDGATTPRPARSPLHSAIAARAPSAAEFFPRASLGPRQRRRTSRPPTCAAITAVIVGAAPLGACACPACPPAKAGAKANSTAKAGARAKSTAWLVPRLKGSPLSLFSEDGGR